MPAEEIEVEPLAAGALGEHVERTPNRELTLDLLDNALDRRLGGAERLILTAS